MAIKAPSFSVIVTCHNEQSYLINSLESVKRNIEHHLSFVLDASYEIILVLDNPDEVTKSIAKYWATKNKFVHVIHSIHGDVGISRNLGISHSKFDVIFLLDGDDCWGLSWLTKSISHFQSNPATVILHPELVLYKSVKIDSIRRHIATIDPDFDPWILSKENLWTSSISCFRSIFDSINFPNGSTKTSNLYAYEDWSFFRESYNIGIPHLVIPETVHLVNTRIMSNTAMSYEAQHFPWPSDLFYNLIKKNI
jgi:glycosyltransferase involved in cell wall biosynthesis